jgi:hypothetical protein
MWQQRPRAARRSEVRRWLLAAAVAVKCCCVLFFIGWPCCSKTLGNHGAATAQAGISVVDAAVCVCAGAVTGGHLPLRGSLAMTEPPPEPPPDGAASTAGDDHDDPTPPASSDSSEEESDPTPSASSDSSASDDDEDSAAMLAEELDDVPAPLPMKRRRPPPPMAVPVQPGQVPGAPLHGRMAKRSMSVLGDAVMAAAAAAALKGGVDLLSTATNVGVALSKNQKGATPKAGATRAAPSEAAEAADILAKGVSTTDPDNPEPILARGALVRKGRNLATSGYKGAQNELMECRPLFQPMRSNAIGAEDHPGMEPTILINTSFISQIDGQDAKVTASASKSGGVNVAKFTQDHRALLVNFFRLEFRSSEHINTFRRALGLAWYQKLPLLMLALAVCTGVWLLLQLQEEVLAAQQELDALYVTGSLAPDLSDQVLPVRVGRHYVTPGRTARVCRCVHWPFDPRVRYHATKFTAVEENVFAMMHQHLNRTIIHSFALYHESGPVAAEGYGYCSDPQMRNNHECPDMLDGRSPLQLAWQWSGADGWPHSRSRETQPFAGLPMDGVSAGALVVVVEYEPLSFPRPLSSTPFSFWDESGVTIRLTTQPREQPLSRLTFANLAFQAGPVATNVSHCFSVSLRGDDVGPVGTAPANSTYSALRPQGLVSVLDWTVRTRQAGIAVAVSAWRPPSRAVVSPVIGMDIDLGDTRWRSKYTAWWKAMNASLPANATFDPARPSDGVVATAAPSSSWQYLWGVNDTAHAPRQPRTHNFATVLAPEDRCSCYGDALEDQLGGCIRRSQPEVHLVMCHSVLQDGDMICTRCTYSNNGTQVWQAGLGDDDEMCAGYLSVFPQQSVLQQRYAHTPSCEVGFHAANQSAGGCVDTNECSSSPCGSGACSESTTVPLSSGMFHPVVPAPDQACRFAHPLDNKREYYHTVTVGRFDRASCQAQCAARSEKQCRGYEYRASTGSCELWRVTPSSSAPASGRLCFVRVGVAGDYACV